MSVELEVTVKVKVSDSAETSVKPLPLPLLARLMARVATHPCVLMILREFAGKS